MSLKIEMKDKRILDQLDREASIPLSQLAKKAGVSTPVANYRLKRLISKKLVYFFTLIDPGKLGYTLFRVHIKLKDFTEESYNLFAKHLFEDYPTLWVAFVSGNFDIIADIWAKNSNDFYELIRNLLTQHKGIIHSYEAHTILEVNLYDYGYFLHKPPTMGKSKVTLFRNVNKKEVDKVDRKILHVIKGDPRISYEAIGKKVGLTRNAVKYRVLRMKKEGIIAGEKMFINFKQFNRLTYRIFIKYDSSKIEEERKLMNYLAQAPILTAVTKHLETWNLDVEVQPKDGFELQKFLIDLRNKFEIVESFEFIQVLDDYGINLFSEKLLS